MYFFLSFAPHTPQETFTKHWVLNDKTFMMGTWNNGNFTLFDVEKLKAVGQSLKLDAGYCSKIRIKFGFKIVKILFTQPQN